MRVLAKTSNTATIAISVNISAFNIANSGGAAIGGAATAARAAATFHLE